MVTVDHKPSMTQPDGALVKESQGWGGRWEVASNFGFLERLPPSLRQRACGVGLLVSLEWRFQAQMRLEGWAAWGMSVPPSPHSSSSCREEQDIAGQGGC